ncbi:MAG: hypothetical protein EXR31_10465 [Betaproteobacteria bacterium]|nr:hypothetical protein [Betaproteobacteria bacterium]
MPVETPLAARRAPAPRRRGTPLMDIPGRPGAELAGVRVYRQAGNGTGEIACGDLDVSEATEEGIIDRFPSIMPKPGDRPVIFRLVPITLDGDTVIHLERRWTVDANHLYLVRTRERAETAGASEGNGNDPLLRLIGTLQATLATQAEQLEALRKDNQAIIREGVAERERHIGLVHADVSEGYREVMGVHREAIKTVQTDLAGGYDRVLAIQKETAEAHRIAVKAEADARVAGMRAETEATLTRIRVDGEIERQRLESRERMETARLDGERERLRSDTKEREGREDKRRVEEKAERERREAREREDAMRFEDMRNEQNNLTRQFFETQTTMMRENSNTQLALVKAKADGDNPLGGAAKLLAMFGLTPADALTFLKGTLAGGGGGGWAEKLIEQAGTVGAEWMKTARVAARIQARMEDEEDEEDDNEGAPAQLPLREDRPLPSTSLAPSPPAALSVTATTAAPAAPAIKRSRLAKPMLRRVRDAMATLVEALKAEPDQGKWGSVITPALVANPEIIEWLREQSIEGALRDVQADDAFITQVIGVLDASGMVPGDIPRRQS